MSCVDCFQKGRRCEYREEGCCVLCARKRRDHPASNPAPSLHESDIAKHLDCLVQDFHQTPASLRLSLRLQTRTQSTLRDVERTISITTPFFPNQDYLRMEMDTFIWDDLSLKLRGTDPESHWVSDACSAGGYLCLMFPHLELDDRGRPIHKYDVHNGAEQHVTRFCLFRFGDFIDIIMRELRAVVAAASDLKLRPQTFDAYNRALNIIAAAVVLSNEIHHVRNSPAGRTRLLCHAPELEKAVRAWLQSADSDITTQLRALCGRYPIWSSNLGAACKNSQRHFNIRMIKLDISTPGTPLTSPWGVESPPSLSGSPMTSILSSEGGSPAMQRSPSRYLVLASYSAASLAFPSPSRKISGKIAFTTNLRLYDVATPVEDHYELPHKRSTIGERNHFGSIPPHSPALHTPQLDSVTEQVHEAARKKSKTTNEGKDKSGNMSSHTSAIGITQFNGFTTLLTEVHTNPLMKPTNGEYVRLSKMASSPSGIHGPHIYDFIDLTEDIESLQPVGFITSLEAAFLSAPEEDFDTRLHQNFLNAVEDDFGKAYIHPPTIYAPQSYNFTDSFIEDPEHVASNTAFEDIFYVPPAEDIYGASPTTPPSEIEYDLSISPDSKPSAIHDQAEQHVHHVPGSGAAVGPVHDLCFLLSVSTT